MLEAALADVAEQLLKLRDAYHAGAAKGFERIVGELAFPDVAVDRALAVVGGKAHETHRPGLPPAYASPINVLTPHRACPNGLEVHVGLPEEVPGKVAAMEANRLVGVVTVIVVPVEQGAGRSRGQLQGVHADHAANIHLAGAGHQVLAHHAHDGAGYHAKELLEGSPALDAPAGDFGLAHPLTDHSAELGHLE